MAKRTPAPKSMPATDAVAATPVATPVVTPSPGPASSRPAARRSVAEWVLVPTYLMLAIAFVPVGWLTGSKKAK